jgi:hypothetical protein
MTPRLTDWSIAPAMRKAILPYSHFVSCDESIRYHCVDEKSLH